MTTWIRHYEKAPGRSRAEHALTPETKNRVRENRTNRTSAVPGISRSLEEA